MCEEVGFWIGAAGWLLLVFSGICANERCGRWAEKNLHVPSYVSLCALVAGIMLMMIGGHMWCIGNRGQYPGYPLNHILEWFR